MSWKRLLNTLKVLPRQTIKEALNTKLQTRIQEINSLPAENERLKKWTVLRKD